MDSHRLTRRQEPAEELTVSKKHQHIVAADPVVEAPVAETPATETVIETAPVTENAPAADAAPATETAPVAKPKPEPAIFEATDKLASAKVQRGLWTEVQKQFALTPTGTIEQIVDGLLASGAYQKVAPQAANLRKYKPVSFICRTWARNGLLRITNNTANAAPAETPAAQ